MALPHDVTLLLREWANGDQSALAELTPLVFAELRRLAESYLRSEAPGHTLQPTALVHEAFLRMVGRSAPKCENRSEFYGVAARLMSQILIDHARTRQAIKRGGAVVHYSLDEDQVISLERDSDFVALDDALDRLAVIDPRKSQVVELRFFGGLSVQETVEVLKVSEKTVRREWQFAKAWLVHEFERGEARWTLSACIKSNSCIMPPLEREEDERKAFLREVCSADEVLRREVETLLACGKKSEDVFELPAMDLAARARDEVQSHPAAPVGIGPYRILDLLGEDGMGAVYEAGIPAPRRSPQDHHAGPGQPRTAAAF